MQALGRGEQMRAYSIRRYSLKERRAAPSLLRVAGRRTASYSTYSAYPTLKVRQLSNVREDLRCLNSVMAE